MRWKGEEIKGGGEGEEGGEGGEDPARSRYDPAERGRASVEGPAIGSRTDLESRIMPRPCWNFWGPYWPISRVSDHLRAGPGAQGPRSLRVAPTTPCQSPSGSPMGLQRYVQHRGRERTDFFFPILRTVPSRVLSLPSSALPHHLFLFALETSERNPRRLARIFLGLYYYCRGSTQMVSSTGRFVRSAERGFIFLPPLCSPHPCLLSPLLFLFLLRRRRRRHRRPRRRHRDVTAGPSPANASFFVRRTFFPGN